MQKATFSLAKAIHFICFAIAYLQDVVISEQMTGNSKHFIGELVKRLQWVLNNIYARMSADGATILRKEIDGRDIAVFDSVFNMMLTMTEEERQQVEDFATGITQKQAA